MADTGKILNNSEGLRKRTHKQESSQDQKQRNVQKKNVASQKIYAPGVTTSGEIASGSYWLTRIVLIRYLGFIYFVAFLVALHQNKQLLGSKGLLPAHIFLNRVKHQNGGFNWSAFTTVPSVIWFFDYEEILNDLLDYIAYGGLALSTFLIINGGANWFIMFTLWGLYHSLVNVGQRWYGFGWESQLLETGFLAIFLCPLFSVSAIPRFTPTSQVVIWGYRWLIFRIMLGAGLIKIRGDKCWKDLTCMNYHYEVNITKKQLELFSDYRRRVDLNKTQPVPNPVSYYMHQSPEWFHKFETSSNHFVELMAPLLLLMPSPRCMKMIGGAIQILFQVVLIISGNLSFLNWLTILPSLSCFDDRSVAWMFSRSVRNKVASIQEEDKQGKSPKLKTGNYIRRVFNITLGVLLAYLSIPVVQNLMSSRQHMNTSFDPFRLVNTYGAFGSVTKDRTEVIYQGTYGDPKDSSTKWLEYEFKCKPGRITRRPCLISPYHYRLDWLLWFAAFQNYQHNPWIVSLAAIVFTFQNYQHNPWIVSLAAKLLENDNATVSLIEHNPFENQEPPKYIRVQHYSYRFTKIDSKDAEAGRWWKRRLIGQYLKPVSQATVNFLL